MVLSASLDRSPPDEDEMNCGLAPTAEPLPTRWHSSTPHRPINVSVEPSSIDSPIPLPAAAARLSPLKSPCKRAGTTSIGPISLARPFVRPRPVGSPSSRRTWDVTQLQEAMQRLFRDPSARPRSQEQWQAVLGMGRGVAQMVVVLPTGAG